MIRPTSRIIAAILLLALGAFCFLDYLGNAFAYSDWVGLASKVELARTAQHRATVLFWVFAGSELLAFQLLFSLFSLRNRDLSGPLKILARAATSACIIVLSIAAYLCVIFIYSRWRR